GWVLPVVRSADKTCRGGTCNVELLRLNPRPDLFPDHHAQQTEQSDDGRCRTLHAKKRVEDTHAETDDERRDQSLHVIRSHLRGLRTQNSRNPGAMGQSRPAPGDEIASWHVPTSRPVNGKRSVTRQPPGVSSSRNLHTV